MSAKILKFETVRRVGSRAARSPTGFHLAEIILQQFLDEADVAVSKNQAQVLNLNVCKPKKELKLAILEQLLIRLTSPYTHQYWISLLRK